MPIKRRSLAACAAAVLALLFATSASACWVCEYEWFQGEVCTPTDGQGWEFCGGVIICSTWGLSCNDGGGGCGDGVPGGCEPENQGLRLEAGDAVLRLADAGPLTAAEPDGARRCAYTID